MIPRTPIAKGVSLLASIVFVGGAAWHVAPDHQIELEGAGEAMEAHAGTAFEDLVQGVLTAEPAEEEARRAVPLDRISPTRERQAAAQAVRTAISQTTAVLTPHVQQAEVLPSSEPSLAPLVSTAASLAAAQPAQMAPEVAVNPNASRLPTETLAALTPVTKAPVQSARPKRKDPKQAADAAARAPKPKVAKATPAPKPVPSGNAQRTASKGAVSGADAKAKTASQGTVKRASALSGNAAVSNYPGKVMRRISRVGKPRVRGRGAALVGFSIASNGGLAKVWLARSSGSPDLDQAAMRVIRKAAPFPRPPQGAKRQFSVQIEGR